MNILILDSWLREYLKTSATPQEIAKYLSLCGPSVQKLIKSANDYIYDIEITTNRVDLMSVVGMAKEAAVILRQFALKASFVSPLSNLNSRFKPGKLKISIKDPLHTNKRIMAVVMDNINLHQSAAIIRQRLNSANIRSINNVVDITNYLMLSLGQPTHVFDYDRIKSGKLLFRYSKKGEKVTSLEDKTYTLPGGDIVIDDSTGRIIDLPGIIGTANSVVTGNTKRILFFIDCPDPVKLRRTSMTLGIRTMAATINEKTVAPDNARTALLWGIQLFSKHANARVHSEIFDYYPNPVSEKKVTVTLSQIKSLVGVTIDNSKLTTILNSLNLQCAIKSDQLTVKIPASRQNDITAAEDIIEEIARIYGYHNLPSVLPKGDMPEKLLSLQKTFQVESKIKQLLVTWGFNETYNYSMVSKKDLDRAQLSPLNHLRITNPLSEDWQFLRRTLIPSLLPVINHNQNLFPKMKLFEMSTVFIPRKNTLPEEKVLLGGAVNGNNSFGFVKGCVEEFLDQFGFKKISYHHQKLAGYIFAAGLWTIVKLNNRTLLTFGLISPKVLDNFSINSQVCAFEIDMSQVTENFTGTKTYNPISRFPPLIEDFSFTFEKTFPTGPLIDTLTKIDPLISSVTLIDRYGQNAAFRIVFENSKKQLSSQDVIPVRNKIISVVKDKFAASLIGKA